MADTNLNIKVTADTSNAQNNLKNFDQNIGDIVKGIGALTGAALALGAAMKGTFELGKAGAVINQTHESLERMATSAGVAAGLLGRLEEASGNTIDDLVLAGGAARLMAGQSTEMAKALGNAAPEMVTISRAMAKLNPTVGDSSKAFEDLTVALQTGRTRGLAQWGFDLKETTNTQDLLNQIMDQGSGLVTQLSGNVESATDKYNRFEQSVDNLKDSFATLAEASGVVETVIEGLGGNLDATTAIMEAQQAGLISTAQAWGYYAQISGQPGTAAEVLEEIQVKLDMAAASTGALTDAQAENIIAAQEAANKTNTWAESSFYAAQAQDAARASTLATEEAMQKAEEAAEAIAGAFNNVGLAAYEAQVWTLLLAAASGQMSEEAVQAAFNTLDLQKAVAEGTVSMGTYFAIMKDGVITQEEYDTAIGNTTAAQEEATEAAFLQEQQTRKGVDAQQAFIDKAPEMIAQLEGLGEAATNAAGNYSIHFDITTSGNIPGGGGGTVDNPIANLTAGGTSEPPFAPGLPATDFIGMTFGGILNNPPPTPTGFGGFPGTPRGTTEGGAVGFGGFGTERLMSNSIATMLGGTPVNLTINYYSTPPSVVDDLHMIEQLAGIG